MLQLPESTIITKIIPKNAFDAYTNTKQKKAFTDKVLRITWKNKLSKDTINFSGNEVEELHILEIELKEKFEIKDSLLIIQKTIPYHLIIIVRYDSEYFISTAAKHRNPNNEDNAVIDYTFLSQWMADDTEHFNITLKKNLDFVFKNFCEQFAQEGTFPSATSMDDLVKNQKELDKLNREINSLKSKMAKEKQFNKKVELNRKLRELEKRK